MNKHLIILLVAIVAVNAFVKRDVPKDEKSPDLGEQLKHFAEDTGKKLQETFSADNLKQEFNKLLDNASKALDDLKKTTNEQKIQ